MKDILEWLENSSDVQNDILDWEIVKENALEKEKQRMFHCFNAGADKVSDREFNEWFNKTYKQNK